MEPNHRENPSRPYAFKKMEQLVCDLQDPDNGVPVRSQKIVFTSVPAVFMGYDLIEWLMDRLGIEESEALNLANQLCQFGYFFPISDPKTLVVKDDNSLYRFQNQYYWPWRHRPPDNVEYAIYLSKRLLRNKQKHGLEEYELDSLSNLRRNLANRWRFITSQAEEQLRHAKCLKKADKMIHDSQERAYWRVHRPPPNTVSVLEPCPVPTRNWNGNRIRRRTITDVMREVAMLRNNLTRTRLKVSQALQNMVQHVEIYMEYDPLLIVQPTHPVNPWISEDLTYWQLNSPLAEIPTEKRVRRWALSMEELVSDPTGLQEFTNYLRKEYSHENIRFWMAVNDLRRSAQSQIPWKVQKIFEEFLAPGAPCEINIDGKTMEKVHQEMKSPSRFTFDSAQEHVYTLLLKKDCYPRFIRSEYYKNLLATGVQPSQKKRFFGFGPTKKKASTSTAPNQQQLLQQHSSQGTVLCGGLTKRRGSDRSLSGSAHELAISGIKETKVPHSHSQSNLSDIPFRVKKPSIAIVAGTSTSEDVCPWESHPPESRKNSGQLDSGSSSSDISVAVSDVSEKPHRVCGLPQQHTVDSGVSRTLTTETAEQPRRASVSVPVTHSSGSMEIPNRKISSFEDSSIKSTSSVFDIPRGGRANLEVKANLNVKRSVGLAKSNSLAGANAPIINISSVSDEIPCCSTSQDDPPRMPKAEVSEEDTLVEADNDSSGEEPAVPEPLAPLAEPDSESPTTEFAPSEPEDKDEKKEEQASDEKGNDVCPWEDEETCKVDTPFVKTYATLGYL